MRGSSSPGSAGEPTTAPPRVQRDVVSDDDPEKILLDRFNRDMESAQTLAGHVYTQIFRATGEAPPYDELHQLILDIVGGNNAVATAIRDPSQHKTLTEVGYDLHQLVKANTGKRLLPYTVIRKAPYEFKESKVNSKGMFKIDVYTKDEKESIGYAVIEVQKIAKSKPPKQDEPYTKADVLAREGVVAHLHRLFNETLTRDGPADIYRGFGVELLKRAEDLAKRMGARLMYLEAATSDVRTSPSTNDKESVDPTPFYTKFGYGVDAESAAHNWAFAMAQAEQAQLEMSQSIKLAQRQVKGLIEGMLSKMLT
ncbi:MAG: GNAT family N-acetyltransferase [Holophagales bacterium]|nr:GNAT family N-acetyltransferase [Holophagales bacterium]